uniref:NUC153 domain-containing protein n=1 Tax=Macrostomum lignano TaxID=282301 RepID=A0A1I8H966_9PLAT
MGTGDTSSKKSEKRKRRRRSRSASPAPPPPAPSSSSSQAQASSSSSSRRQQKQPQHQQDEEEQQSSGDVISLSIEETNKLRAKLGLKPLEVDSSASDPKAKPGSSSTNFLHAPAKSLTQAKHSAKVQERTLIGWQKREMREKLTRLRGLGDDSDEEDKDLSAAAWIERSRNLEAERRLAEQRAKELAELDAEFDVSRLVEADVASSAYSSNDLAGLRVAHSAKKFKEGQTTVLVLQDRGVLDSNDDDAAETLINVNMVDDERHAENVRNRAQVGSAWHAANAGLEGEAGLDDEDDELGGAAGPSVLAKYDSVIAADSASRKRAFVLAGGETEAPAAKSAAALARDAVAAASVSLDGPSELKLAADYLSAAEVAEAAKFKRRKRKVPKSRMLKADDLLPLVDDEEASKGRQEEGELVDEAPTMPGLTDAEIIEQTPSVADEALEDLQLLLERARRVQQQDGRRRPRQLPVVNRRDKQDQEEDSSGLPSASSGMVFDTTAEFCRSLGDASKAATAVAVAQAEARAAVADAAEAASFEASAAAADEEPELRKGGIGAALELARRKGYLESSGGRRDAAAGSSGVSGLRAKKVFQEDLRHDDIDAKFGRRDRLSFGGGGGGGGVQEFKELRNYKPDVKLEYTDDDGRVLNQKDAFDYLSHRFHGKGSGKKKTEKRLKKIKEEELLKSMGSSDTPLGTAEKLHAKLERQGTAYVCLSGRAAAASLPNEKYQSAVDFRPFDSKFDFDVYIEAVLVSRFKQKKDISFPLSCLF